MAAGLGRPLSIAPKDDDCFRLYGGALLDWRFITDGAEDGLDWTTNGGWQRGRGIRQIVGQVANLSHKRMLRPYITRRRLLRRFLFML